MAMFGARRGAEDLPKRILRPRYDSEAAESGSGSGKMGLDTDAENSVDSNPELSDALKIHNELVAYVHSLNGHVNTRSSVWVEHSYARARACDGDSGGAGGVPRKDGDTRELLVRRTPPCRDCHPALDDSAVLDVDTLDPEPRPPPSLSYDDDDSDENPDNTVEEGDLASDFEEKIFALAPATPHRRLVAVVLDILHSLRLERLAGGPGCVRADAVQAHARHFRRALAPYWDKGASAPNQRPVPWVHSILSAYLPRPFASLYERLLSELRRVVPRLCSRLAAGRLPAPARDPAAALGDGPRVRPAPNRPLLIWIPSGRERLDERWERQLGILLPIHRISAPILDACGVEAWCTGVALAVRTALSALEAQSPRSLLALGGVGAGAALALQLAGGVGATPRALVLLGPPLLTAEGPRDTPDDLVADTPHPLLLVVGQNAMQSNVCVASSIVERRRAAGRRSRLVAAGGADDLLRLSARARRHARLPQHAFDAAIAEECARWLSELAEPEVVPPPLKRMRPLSPAPPPAAAAHPATPAHPVPVPAESTVSVVREPIDIVQIQVGHRPQTMPARVTDTSSSCPDGSSNVVRCLRGGVISRGKGGTPLSLPPPRRRTTPAPAATPVDFTGHDILDMPIVFADDNSETSNTLASASHSSPALSPKPQVQVTVPAQKERKFTKVIVAKRTSGASGAGMRPIVVHSGSGVRLVKKANT